MAHYRTSVGTRWPPQRAFAYLADLRNFAAWDPSVTGVRVVTGDEPGPDAVYDVDVKVGPRTMTLRYEIVAWEPSTRVVVRARTAALVSLDEIRVEPDADGSTVVYDADLQLRGALRVADPVLALAFRRIADRAAGGLRRTLAS